MEQINQEVEPLVSIVAICHNHAPYVLETLDSIRCQTYHKIELVVINNLKDDCEGLIRGWIDANLLADTVCFIQNQVPCSIAENINQGLNLLTGDYFQAVACDDVLMPNKIETQLQIFSTLGPEFACVYSNARDIDEFGEVIKYSYGDTLFDKRRSQGLYVAKFGSLAPQLLKNCYISAPTVLLRTCIIRSLGGYDERYLFEDYPMWVKLERAGYKFAHTEIVLVGQRILPSSLGRSTSTLKRSRGRALLYLRNIEFFGMNLRRLLRSFWILVCPMGHEWYYRRLSKNRTHLIG